MFIITLFMEVNIMNQIVPVSVAFLATLFLSVATFSLSAKGADPINAKDVAPNHTVIIPFGIDAMKGEQEEDVAMVEQAPMLLLWEGTSQFRPTPILHFALWRDGTIIWSKSADTIFAWSARRDAVNSNRHFQSKISDKQVEDFLSAFDKIDFLEFSGKMAPMRMRIGPGPTFFFLETENVQFRLMMDSVFWAGDPSPDRRGGGPQMKDKWLAVLGLLLELIPEKGEQISLSIKEEKDKRQFVITPIPLRQADRPRVEENARENNRPGNWGQIPMNGF